MNLGAVHALAALPRSKPVQLMRCVEFPCICRLLQRIPVFVSLPMPPAGTLRQIGKLSS